VKTYTVTSQVNYNRNMEDVMYVSTSKTTSWINSIGTSVIDY
jgi:hypothetical protein